MNRISPLLLFFLIVYLTFANCWVFGNQYGELNRRSTRKKITEKNMKDSINFSMDMYERKKTRETILGYSNVRAARGSPSYALYLANFPEPEALEIMRPSLVAAAASSNLLHEKCYFMRDRRDCENDLKSFQLWNTPISNACDRLSGKCSDSEISAKYRTYDGSCNNPDISHRGRSFTAYEVLMKPNYLAAVRETRRSVTKDVLPSASSISSQLYLNGTSDMERTLAVLYWAQFVEHDLSHTAMTRMVHTGELIECCDPEGRMNSPRYLHDFCLPIRVSSRDVYYATKDISCLSYVRSMVAVGPECSLGSTQQMNQATHFLDASQIYGTTQSRHESSLGTHGQMAVPLVGNSVHFLIPAYQESGCQSSNSSVLCRGSGDKRINENPHITALYTLWTKEHNRIALELAKMNPTWDSTTVFEEARRIVIAEIQHITYMEWIPIVLGMTISESYEPQGVPTVSNEFATAGIRAFHSAGPSKRSLLQEEREYINDTSKGIGNLLEEMVVEEFRGKRLQYLGEENNKIFGYDVLSMDIQRGRDHGLPTYNEFRKYCGLRKVKSFDNLKRIMHPKTVESLKKGYTSVEDIDLIVGGISETAEKGLFGPTISCILAKQFKQTRKADRYFYDNLNQPTPFSDDQINEINKTTLARIICDNTNVTTITPNVFGSAKDISSDRLSCKSDVIPRLNLKFWDANRYYYTRSP